MAQRKSSPSASSRSGPAKTPNAKAGSGSRAGTTRAAAAAKATPARPPGRPPAKKKPGKSIVNQKQTPWGLIITTVAIVVFAAAIVTYAVVSHKSSKSDSNPYTQPEVAAAKAIKGVTYKAEPKHNHVAKAVKYNTSPPIGGDHSPIWADCAGTIYPKAIANENAVHMLEHGAVWITYKPGLPAAQVAALSKLVSGIDRMAMSPYPGLKANISLQAWNYQLFVNSASDPRIRQFIDALRFNPKTTPEQAAGVTCSDPQFKANPSTFGHPIFNLS
jgi:uncharacterized protein DUF3105